MFSNRYDGRKDKTGLQLWSDSQAGPVPIQVPQHRLLHQRRGQSAQIWKGLLWQPKNTPITNMSATSMRQPNGCFTPPQDWDDRFLNDESGITQSASTRLRHMIENSDKIIVAPGVYDGLSSRIALSVGFDAMYMTGAGTTASRLGHADLGIAQLHDMRENAEMIANLDPNGPPLIADMDTGYGGPIMVARSVQQYIQAGVAGFHIEDQIQQKRCGHLAGKEVEETEVWLQRLKAAIGARNRLQSNAIIIARTDALQQKGYDECIARLKAARDIGADVGILEGFTSHEQARQAVVDLAPWPMMLNSVENGVSPTITVQEAQDIGFKIMIFSFAALAPAYIAIKATFEWLKAEGVTGVSVSPKAIYQVCGLKESMEIDQSAGGNAYSKGI